MIDQLEPGRDRLVRQRAARGATVLAWLGLGLIELATVAHRLITVPTEIRLRSTALASGIWVWYAIAAPSVIWLALRFDFRAGRRIISAVVHAAAALLVQLGLALSFALLARGWQLADFGGQPIAFVDLLLDPRGPVTLLSYLMMVGLAWGTGIWYELREQRVVAERARRQATEARLEALTGRLRPHVLFNTLHAIGVLLDRDPRRGRTMMTQLGDLLRDLLDEHAPTAVTLEQELRLLGRYLAVEQIRFGEALTVEINVSPDARAMVVPRLLLQPLVENAIRHGLAPRGTGRITITDRVADGQLTLVVRNDGEPLPSRVGEGLGLRATRERLDALTPAGTLVLRTTDRGSVEAVVTLPARGYSAS